MNINRDYLIINDVKKSNIRLDNGSMFFYITDKNTQNIFVNLVINVSNNDLIQKYANIENAEDYTLAMNIVKPDNTYKIIEGKLHDKEKAIFEFDLKEDCCDEVGTYKCELLTKCNINDREEITTSNKLTYKVKSSILNNLDDIVNAPEYPLVIQLFDKLSDIEQYEEDRRANELARQLAEEQRQARFNTLDADMTNSIQAIDDKVVDVENRISAKEQAVDKLIVDTKADIDNYKVAKDQEIDEYKATKDTEINNAVTAQDNKIDTAISEQNNRITVVENNVVAQNNRLDVLENRDTIHESRMTAIEAKNTEQDNRLDAIEAIDVAQNTRLDAIEVKNQQQDDRLLDIEKVNKRQDMNLKCLFAESKNNMIDITEEGNSVYLQNSTTGYTLIDEIKGNTLVNCNKEPNKELILNGNINTSGDNTVTLTEGVDGGLVDVALEGNTLVNVSKTKDSTALPLEEELTYLYANTQYTVQFVSDKAITADITLGGTQLLAQSIVAGLNRISITTPATLTDNKLVISGIANIMEVVVTNTDREFGYFEGMKSVGECEELAITSANSDNSSSNTQQLTHEPLRAAGDARDRYVLIDGKWFIERRCMKLTFNGSEPYWSAKGYGGHETRNTFEIYIDPRMHNKSGVLKSICDRYMVEEVGNIPTKDNSYRVVNDIRLNNKTYFLFTPSTSIIPYRDLDAWKEWLSENPITIIVEYSPYYEPLDYNPLEVYSDVTHITANSTIPTNITVKNHGFNCLLKPSTTYTISSNLGLNTVTTPSTLIEDCLRFMDTDTSDVTTMRDVLVLEGDWTTKSDLIPANFSGIESAFEQELVTDENDEHHGKYKVNVKVTNEDKTQENNITFYIDEPLRGVGDVKDRVFIKDDKVVVQRNCGIRPYEDGDFGTYPTDKVNTVYPLAEPTYEEVEYNDTKLFIESFKNSTLFYNSNVPVTSKLYYSYSVPIVDTVAQTASISDQQDSMIIDLATQVAVMEMMLM